MTKAEAAVKIAELEVRVEALEMALIQARATWGQTGDPAAVFHMILARDGR